MMSILLIGMVNLAHSAEITKNIRWSIENRSEDVQWYQVYKSSSEDWQVMEPFGDKILITSEEYQDKTEIIHQLKFQIPDKEDTVVFFSVRAIDTSGNVSNYALDTAGRTVFVGFRFMNEPPTPPVGIGAN